jgi:hypothetical protein
MLDGLASQNAISTPLTSIFSRSRACHEFAFVGAAHGGVGPYFIVLRDDIFYGHLQIGKAVRNMVSFGSIPLYWEARWD